MGHTLGIVAGIPKLNAPDVNLRVALHEHDKRERQANPRTFRLVGVLVKLPSLRRALSKQARATGGRDFAEPRQPAAEGVGEPVEVIGEAISGATGQGPVAPFRLRS